MSRLSKAIRRVTKSSAGRAVIAGGLAAMTGGGSLAIGAAAGAGAGSAGGRGVRGAIKGGLIGGGIGYGIGALTGAGAGAGAAETMGADITGAGAGEALAPGVGAGAVANPAAEAALQTQLDTVTGDIAGRVAGGGVTSPGFLSKWGVPLALGATSLLKRPANVPELGNLEGVAGPAAAASAEYINAARSGQLPAGHQAALDDMVRSQKAAIEQQYAGMGMGDSTGKREALARVDNAALISKEQILQSIMSQGLSAAGIAVGPYATIAQTKLAQDAQMQSTLGNFAMMYGLMQAGQGA